MLLEQEEDWAKEVKEIKVVVMVLEETAMVVVYNNHYSNFLLYSDNMYKHHSRQTQ